ncbi:MAG: NAD(P)-binding domain-containing protein [Sphingomonadales bacterium]|nr:NAD(P)-binding domain-containing protein [Sphingomonadales bacterium]
MSLNTLLLVYALPLLALWALWVGTGKWRSRRAQAILDENIEAGLMEPNTLHPIIDPARCLGCAACARACPEKTVLGIIDGKAALIEPTMCVGHGACATACPTNAITLVFGSETRGVDIPLLSPEFETSVPGIFIAGELGGMGLIKNAIEQGRQAIEHVARHARRVGGGGAEVLDVVIVGCGPAGIAASLGAIERKLSFVTIDQATLGGTVAHFPRGKLVMTAPATLPLVGKVKFGEISKEKLLAFWEDVLARTGLQPHFEEQVTAVQRSGDLFEITSSRGRYRARAVLLAIGRRGTPRTLDVPGEELQKVVYRLIDPEQYAGRNVLVVGGGDSALEAAVRLAEQPGTNVTLSYRSASYARARARNRESMAAFVASGRVEELLQSRIVTIEPQAVTIAHGGELRKIANDDVIICAGGVLPTQFLHEMGINVETKFGVV